MSGPLELPGLLQHKAAAQYNAEPLHASFLNTTKPVTELWLDSSGLGRIPAAELGGYALSTNPDQDVADWTEHFKTDGVQLRGQLQTYIQACLEDASGLGIRLADIVTSQYLLDNPVIEGEELVSLANRMAREEFMGIDNLMILAGFLPRQDLAILVNGLPDSSTVSKDFIKRAARKVENRLMLSDEDFEESQAVSEFARTVDAASSSDEIAEYGEDLWGAKVFLKREGEEPDRIAMVRRNDIENFAGWLRAYEAEDIWQANGLDYVPVEPILHFAFDAIHGAVDARTVLFRSISFARARQQADRDGRKELLRQAKAIASGLNAVGVHHGHLHEDNLQVLETARGPRTYAIDFDKAQIRKNPN